MAVSSEVLFGHIFRQVNLTKYFDRHNMNTVQSTQKRIISSQHNLGCKMNTRALAQKMNFST